MVFLDVDDVEEVEVVDEGTDSSLGSGVVAEDVAEVSVLFVDVAGRGGAVDGAGELVDGFEDDVVVRGEVLEEPVFVVGAGLCLGFRCCWRCYYVFCVVVGGVDPGFGVVEVGGVHGEVDECAFGGVWCVAFLGPVGEYFCCLFRCVIFEVDGVGLES